MRLPNLSFPKLRRLRIKRFPTLQLSRRQVFVIATAFLTMMLVITQLSQTGLQKESVLLLVAISYTVAVFTLREDLRGIEYLTLFILPVYFTVAVALFYFLLPSRLLTRLPIALLYAVGMYAILLSANIYNVALERTIQLVRAAHGVGFLLTLVTVFFLQDAVLSLHKSAGTNAWLVFLVSFPLALQLLWSVELEPHISRRVLIGTTALSIAMAEAAFALSFWPVRTTIAALFLTSIFYAFAGMSQQHLVGRLFQRTKIEFLSVLLLVFLLMVFTTHWGGLQ